MNLSAPFIAQFFKAPLMDAMPYVDIIFGNETVSLFYSDFFKILKILFLTLLLFLFQEASVFATEQNFGTTDLKEIALKLCKLSKQNAERGRVAIITQGSEAVLLAKDGKVIEIAVDKLDASKIVDTNGAGDAFVGGFLAQLVQKKSLEICVKCGIWAARQIIQRSGCTFDGAPELSDFTE